MNKQALSFGSDSSRDIVIVNPAVNGHHGEMVYLTDEHILLKDQSSLGTFVNNRRIKTKTITSTDSIQFGNEQISGQEVFKLVRKAAVKNRVDFTAEYATIRSKFQEYEQQYSRISNKRPLGPIIVKGLLTIAVIIAIRFAPKGWISQDLTYPLIIITGILGTVFTTSGKGNDKKKDAISLLKVSYKDVLQCPKCSVSLMRERLIYWDKHKGCNQCDAQW